MMKTKIILLIGLVIGLGFLFVSDASAAKCGGTDTALIECSQNNGGKNLESNGVWGLLLFALNIMTAGVGILGVGGVVYGSIRIASAGDNSGNVKKGINIILNTAGGIFAYIAMYAILQYLIPGGIF